MSVAEARKRDPEATRAAILAAAELLFVDKGFAATSMSDIASEAGVTKSLIHHHFGTKEELWQEIKKLRFSHYAEVQRRLTADASNDGGNVLEQSMRSMFQFFRDNPEYVRLSVWMQLEDPKLAELVYPELFREGVARVRREQIAGRLRPDVEAKHLIASMISLCSHWFMARHHGFAALVGDSEDADEQYLEDSIKIFLEGVKPR